MTLMELGALGEFVGSVAVFVTLIYLAVQVRQNTTQQRREETLSIQQGQNSVLAHLLDPTMIRAFALVADGEVPVSIADRARTIIWILQYLNQFQIVYDLRHGGSLDDARYRLWEGFAVSIVAPKGIRKWWDGENGKLAFSPEVRDLIDRRLADTADPPAPLNEMWSIYNSADWTAYASEGSAS
jgi:hypothetical protein